MSRKLIRLSKSVIGDNEKRAVSDVLDREYLGMGREVQEFEGLLTEFIGRTAICLNSGTAALHLALQSIGLKPGDEVLVQSLTYLASFQAISATGAKPVACEIDPSTITLDIKDAEKRITGSTKAIMPVHYSGAVGELDKIYNLAEKYSLRVIEDAAHAFGSFYNGKKVGSFGDISCFSFDGIKNITSGEGGAVITDDLEVIRRVQDARLLGVEKDTEKRYEQKRSWDFDVTYQGWRYHMSNIMAAIGIEQLKKFDKFSEWRKTLAKRYLANLRSSKSIDFLNIDYSSVVPHIFAIKLNRGNKKKIRALLLEEGIETGVHYLPNSYLTFYKNNSIADLPVTKQTYEKLLSLPLHPDLTDNDVDFVCDKLLDFIETTGG